MNECPKCGTVYTDTTLAFCLADGTPLTGDAGQAKTEVLPEISGFETEKSVATLTEMTNRPTDENVIASTSAANTVTAGRGWIISTFCLLGVVIAGSVVGVLIYSGGFKTEKDKPAANTNTAIGQGSIAKPGEKLYRVTGVRSDDVLYVRPAPGNLKIVVGKLYPGATGIRVTGDERTSGKSKWVRIEYQGIRGWVNKRYLAEQ